MTLHLDKFVSYWLLISLIGIINVSCSEETDDPLSDEDPDEELVIDPVIVGSWRSPFLPTGFSIDELGLVTHLRLNYLTGKFESVPLFQDKIKAINNVFEYLESDDCFVPTDSTYWLRNDTLSIPILKSWAGSTPYYLPLDIETYVGPTRKSSYLKALISIKAFWGEETIDFDAGDPYELLELFSYPNSPSSISGYDNPEFSCNRAYWTYHYLRFATGNPIIGIGTYDLISGLVQIAGQEGSNSYNLSYSNPDYFVEGRLNVTHYEQNINFRTIQGSFEYVLAFESNGGMDTVTVTNGSLDVTEYF